MRAGSRKTQVAAVLGLVLSWASPASAGFTDTPPADTFLLDTSFFVADLTHAYDNEGRLRPLLDPIPRYEPGGGLQGTLVPEAHVRFMVLVQQVYLGLLDSLTVGFGIPVVLRTTVDPGLRWVPGDYQPPLGRPYSEEDFWAWAASMGQPRPGPWVGNRGVLGDVVLGVRWRFSDHVDWLARRGLRLAVTVMAALPTGRPPDPEEVTAAGTTSWDLHAQGELAVHLSVERTFPEVDDRLTVGLDGFYEVLFRHRYRTPTGTKHPLLLNRRPYVGETYTLDPGDFSGISLQVEGVPWKGPARASWITGGDEARARRLPPLVTLAVRYTHVHLGQSDWESDSALWDWEQERSWRPGYKNVLSLQGTVSLLRLGVPLDVYGGYRNQTWIGGKNCRASNVWFTGVRVPLKFW